MQKLAWNDFFKMRKKLVTMQRVMGIPGLLGFLTAEAAVLSMPIFDPTATIFDLDPFIVITAATFAGSALSFIAAGTLTRQVWRLMNKDAARQMDVMQKDFYSRISKHRVNVPPNPTRVTSVDFYGEKIHSVQDYRKWLRKQIKTRNDRVFKL